MWCRSLHRLNQLEGIEKPENSSKDINGNWQPFLDIMFENFVALKVLHNLKSYEQEYFRTMFLSKDIKNPVNGFTYEIKKQKV